MADLRDQEVIYSGKRFVIRDGEEVEAWEVYRNGEPLKRVFSPNITLRWGRDEKGWRRHGAVMLAWSLCADALGVDEAHPVKDIAIDIAWHVIGNLPDFWVLTRSDVLAAIRELEAKEVRRG